MRSIPFEAREISQGRPPGCRLASAKLKLHCPSRQRQNQSRRVANTHLFGSLVGSKGGGGCAGPSVPSLRFLLLDENRGPRSLRAVLRSGLIGTGPSVCWRCWCQGEVMESIGTTGVLDRDVGGRSRYIFKLVLIRRFVVIGENLEADLAAYCSNSILNWLHLLAVLKPHEFPRTQALHPRVQLRSEAPA